MKHLVERTPSIELATSRLESRGFPGIILFTSRSLEDPSPGMPSNDPSSAHEEPENALVKRARGGDDSAFERLIDRHGPDLLRYVTRLTRNADEALDVFQDTFFRAFRSLATLREPGAFRSWVATIATNMVRKRQNRARQEPVSLFDEPLDPESTHPSTRDRDDLRSAMLRTAIDELPARQRAVLSLRLEVGLPFHRIGEVLGITEENARAHHYQALKTLRRRMPQFAERENPGGRS